MATCKLCKKKIPKGNQFCDDCKDKVDTIQNESYLDSLLSSVTNTPVSMLDNYSKKEKSKVNNNMKDAMNENLNEKLKDAMNENLNEKWNDEMNEDLNEKWNDEIIEELNDKSNEFNEEEMKVASYEDEEMMSSSYEDEEALDMEEFLNLGLFIDDEEVENNQYKGDQDDDYEELDYDINLMEDSQDHSKAEFKQGLNENEDLNENQVEKQEENQNVDSYENYEEDFNADQIKSEMKEFLDEISEVDSYDPGLEALINQFDSLDSDNELYPMESENMNQNDTVPENANKDLPEENSGDDDIEKILSQIDPNDPVAEDVRAINELLSGKTAASSNDSSESQKFPSHVGEVFSDALTVVSSLDDPESEENLLLDQIFDNQEENQGKEKKKKKVKKKRKEKKKEKVKVNSSLDDTSDQESEGKKKGFLKRLFGKTKEEKTKEEKTNLANDSDPKEDPLEISETTEQKKKSKKTVQKKVDKKTAKKASKKTPKKSKNKMEDAREDSLQEKLAPTKTVKLKLSSKDDKKKQKKKEVRREKKKKNEIIEVIDELEEYEGQINPKGASFVILFFGIMVIVLLFGTNLFSYTISIKNASKYFSNRKYNEAYNEVYGIDIKDEDIELYDKIMTVMYVNKQLNSYNNYYAINRYPEALDSLLKGLERYDKYIELATLLGIDSDLDYVRNQILAELNKIFNLSEEEAIAIINSENQYIYSLSVYDVVLENMKQ